MRNKVPHMGKLVRKIALARGLRAPELALLLEISPSSVNRLFRKPFLHEKLMLKLCRLLEHDLFAHLCQCPKDGESVTGELVNYKQQVKELEKENEALKKENGMLVEMNALLRDKR